MTIRGKFVPGKRRKDGGARHEILVTAVTKADRLAMIDLEEAEEVEVQIPKGAQDVDVDELMRATLSVQPFLNAVDSVVGPFGLKCVLITTVKVEKPAEPLFAGDNGKEEGSETDQASEHHSS